MGSAIVMLSPVLTSVVDVAGVNVVTRYDASVSALSCRLPLNAKEVFSFRSGGMYVEGSFIERATFQSE